MIHMWKIVGDWAFLGVAISAGLFSLLYLFLSPWYKTTTGRNIMAVMGSLAIATIYFAIAIQIGRIPFGFYPTRALIFTALFAAIAWRVVIFVREQLLVRKEGKQDHDSRT
jgi:hypothetical protein